MENGNEPASKQDIERVIETMRDIQTELLKAFYNFMESNRQRVA